MSEALNIIKAHFGSLREVTTAPVWQYNYGQKLEIDGIPNLPSTFEIHYSNSKARGTAKRWIGYDGVVDVLDEYFRSGADVWGFIFLHEGEDDGETEYVIHIPVKERSEAEDSEPIPVQRDIVDEAIAALNAAVAQCGAYVEHYPTVINGEWYVWDEAQQTFVTTNVPATGNGIASAVLNQDYTLTLTFTDGTQYTTPSIRGAQGDTGATGATPDFSIGTVTTLPAGSSASATITGTADEPVLNLSIPQGQDGAITNLDTTLSIQGKAADAKATGDEIDDLKSAITNIPKVAESDATGVDLDVSDKYGNVLARFKDGHFQTKEFDSSEVVTAVSALTSTVKKISDGYEDLTASIVYNASATNTITIEDTFKKGEEIWFHLDDGLKPWDNGKRASYYEGSTLLESNRRGTNGYYCHVVNADCASVKITIASGEYDNETSLTLHVYRITGEIKPKIVTVKSDGSGMYTTIRAAIDSITDANHLVNPYIIEVYPGTYNTLAGYTDEEIESAGDVEHYTQTSMVGPKLTDGMSMRGIGRADEIILMAELSTSTWSSDVRGNISTLNMQGEGSLENLTIIGKYIRYCVHDDFGSPANSCDKRILRDLVFKGTQLSYYPIMTTYGAGMSYPRDYLIENCDFGYDLGIHSSSGYTYGCTIEVNNCSGFRFRIGDRASSSGDAFNRVLLNNCDFQIINISHSDNTLASHMQLIGTGCDYSIVSDASASMYRLGMIDLFPTGLTTGALVKRESSDFEVEETSDIYVARGIVIGSDSDYSYVQHTGYIGSNYLGLTGLAVGDYVTVDESTHLVITGGTIANAVGVVEAVNSNGIAYIKMLI